MRKSQIEVGLGSNELASPVDDRTRIERARDEMSQDAYDELIQEALRLAVAHA